MQRGRGLLALTALLALAASCGRPGAGGSISSGPDYTIYEATYSGQAEQVVAIDSLSGSPVRRLPLGTATGDWTHLYSVAGGSVTDTDPGTGAIRHRLPVPAPFGLPAATMSGVPGGLSPNGRWLVSEYWDLDPIHSPTATHLLLLDTTFAAPPVRIDLSGDFEFDAMSNDGRRLYLIEYLGGNDYRVRVFDVESRTLDPNVVVDKTSPTETMAGLRLMGVPSRDGAWLYSVYVRATSGAFVHALNLDGTFAFCLDLPGSGYSTDGNEFAWSLAMSPDGAHLYATNLAMGVVTEIDPAGPAIVRTVGIPVTAAASASLIPTVEAKGYGANESFVTPDGTTLVAAAAHGVVWIDTATLQVRGSALGDWRIFSLGLSPDGKTLYALRDSGAIARISVASHAIEGTFDPHAGDPMALMRVATA